MNNPEEIGLLLSDIEIIASDLGLLFPSKLKIQFESWYTLYQTVFGFTSDSKVSMISSDCRVVIYDKEIPGASSE